MHLKLMIMNFKLLFNTMKKQFILLVAGIVF